MEILFVTGNLPYPPSDGWRIRVYMLIRHLSRLHRISLVTFIRTSEDIALAEGLRKYCAEIRLIPRNPRYSPLKLLRGVLGATAFPVLSYQDSRMSNTIKSMLNARRFDLVQAESLQMAQYCTNLAMHTVLDLHNIESLVMKRYAEFQRNPLKQWYAHHTSTKLAAYERQICAQFDRCLTCSDEDRDRLHALAGVVRTSVIPNGVDVEAFKADMRVETTTNSILFVGRMDYHANVDGIRWFCREVFPLLLRNRSDLTLKIVGTNPTEEVRRLAVPRQIEVTGYVEDTRPFLKKASVVIIPLRIGGGTRLKLLEAFAMGKAVVSTTVGAEGIAASPNKEILLADSAEQFADQTHTALMDGALRARLGIAARRFVELRYDWEAIVGRLNAVYDDCLATPSNSFVPVSTVSEW
jgi:sugar transferase (PEP-CTERM/EpsH1 system associated)